MAGTGTEDIDLAAASRCRIAVVNAAGASARSMAETTIGLILGLAHHIPRLTAPFVPADGLSRWDGT